MDVRLISATNQDLDEMVADKQFREDLYFRIKGVTIHIPPLRERREDIPLLIHYFLQQAAEKYGKQIEGIDARGPADADELRLAGQRARSCKNVIENMVVLVHRPAARRSTACPRDIRPAGGARAASAGMNNLVGISIEQAEKELIRNTLKMVNGNREQAAKILGIGERTLYRKIKEYGM